MRKKQNDTPLTEVDAKRIRRNAYIKMAAMAGIVAAAMAFGSVAWFTSNKNVSGSGVGVRVQSMPYTIQTRSDRGYYSEQWESLDTNALEWKVSANHNFDNYVADPENITESEEDGLGLEPGNSGTLEFRIQPNTADTLTVDCVFDIKAYLESAVLDQQGQPVLDENNNPVTELTEINNTALVDYIKAHIMLFAGYNDVTGKYTNLIGNDEDLRRVLENQTYTKNGTQYTTIHWVWPMHLEELTSNNDEVIIYDREEREDVIAYIVANRTGFFRDCTDSDQQVAADLTALSTANNNQVYNRYNIKYDNADLEIGNNISYIILSMQVEQKSNAQSNS